ncbi:hypothetical protein [Trinickia symbiotica]|uniref:Uncharacterized protein n=1 Tax=Trinickia symbiotica TaxID=863227 RepID=A0A2N7X9Q0_9BURK|nr:hypothetical protein [Trinickia symbiotica]PMS38479.1 hypothetical protein C0Z20_00920 [Trinickia symbiotica]
MKLNDPRAGFNDLPPDGKYFELVDIEAFEAHFGEHGFYRAWQNGRSHMITGEFARRMMAAWGEQYCKGVFLQPLDVWRPKP